VSGFLLDTNVESQIVRPKPHSGVVQWLDATDESLLYISVLTLGEIRKGNTLLPEGRRRVSLESWLDHDLVVRFSDRVLPVDAGVADRRGRISGSKAAKKSPLPVINGLLAATALHFNLTLVTRDSSHSEITGPGRIRSLAALS
jgi:toxin FitB